MRTAEAVSRIAGVVQGLYGFALYVVEMFEPCRYRAWCESRAQQKDE